MRKHIAIGTVTLLLLTASATHGALVQYEFIGVTRSINPDFTGVPDGAPFTGSFAYNTEEVDEDNRPDLGLYRFVSFSLTVGSDTVTANPAAGRNQIIIENAGGPTGYNTDQLLVNAFGDNNGISGTIGSFTSIDGFLVSFEDPSNAVFSSDGLPGTALSMADFQFANMAVGGKIVVFPGFAVDANFGGSFSLLQAVPESSNVTLITAGLIGIGLWTRRRRLRRLRPRPRYAVDGHDYRL